MVTDAGTSDKAAIQAALAVKLARLRSGERPRVVDLFSGCGGLGLGFRRAGYQCLGAVDFDADAARSFARNLLGVQTDKHEPFHHDITALDPLAWVAGIGWDRPAEAVDVIIGGPPCPAFTQIGRAKLREVHGEYHKDPRASLYRNFLSFVAALRPLAVVMENVPGFLSFNGRNLAEDTRKELADLGYQSRYAILNAVHYGVPQFRERFVLIALHEVVEADVVFPIRFHRADLPVGYHSTRGIAVQAVRRLTEDTSGYVAMIPEAEEPKPAVSVREAISDLPELLVPCLRFGQRPPRPRATAVAYATEPQAGSYAADMRQWPGFEAGETVDQQITRQLGERDQRLFRAMAPGEQYPEAIGHADRLLQEDHPELVPGSAEYETIRRHYVPPYSVDKFPNKWWKLEPGRPARTLTAHLGKDTYSHIHYDQPRVITVREAARLQSFPDGFRFCGSMNSAFRQIGNAVPPLMAWRIAQAVAEALGVPKVSEGPVADLVPVASGLP